MTDVGGRPCTAPAAEDVYAMKQNETIRRRALWCSGGVLLALSQLLAALSGAKPWEALYFWAFCAGYLLLPGAFWYRVLRLEKRFSAMREMLVLMLGVGYFAVCYCFAGRFGLVWLLRLLPLGPAAAEAALLLRAYRRERPAIRLPGDGALPWLWLLFGFCCLIFSFYISVANADPTLTGAGYLNQDLLWNVGNAESFKLAFPPQDIRFVGVRLAYHYLTELCAGALSWASGVSAYRIFAFYGGPPVLAATLLCVWQLGKIVYRNDRKKAGLLCLLTFFGGCAGLWADFASVSGAFGNTVLIHVISNINAQATAIIFLCIFTALFTLLARGGFACTPAELLVFWAAAFLLTFAKGPEAAIVMCALLVVMLLVLLFQRPPHPVRAFLLGAGCLAVFVCVYFAVFSSGANTSVVWSNNSITETFLGPLVERFLPGTLGRKAALAGCGVALALLLQPVQVFLYLVTLPGDIRRLFRLAPERLLARGAALGGMMAYCVLWHASSSQIYFAFAAFFFMNLLAADLLAEIKRPWLVRAARVLLGVGVASAVFLYAGVLSRGCVQLAAHLGYGVEQSDRYSPVLAGDVEAMDWLRENMPADGCFATNRIHMGAQRDDGISNLYSAFSGRQAYMEGYTYAYTNEGVSEAVVRERRANNALLFDENSTEEQLRAVCAETGVGWLVYSTKYPGSDRQLSVFELVYENECVRIYKVS